MNEKVLHNPQPEGTAKSLSPQIAILIATLFPQFCCTTLGDRTSAKSQLIHL